MSLYTRLMNVSSSLIVMNYVKPQDQLRVSRKHDKIHNYLWRMNNYFKYRIFRSDCWLRVKSDSKTVRETRMSLRKDLAVGVKNVHVKCLWECDQMNRRENRVIVLKSLRYVKRRDCKELLNISILFIKDFTRSFAQSTDPTQINIFPSL